MSEATSAHNIRKIVHGEHPDPFSVLGLHTIKGKDGESTILRAFVPWAQELSAIFDGAEAPVTLDRIHPGGFFAAASAISLSLPD